MTSFRKLLFVGAALTALSACYTDPADLEAESEREARELLNQLNNGGTGSTTGRYTIQPEGTICSSSCTFNVQGNNFQVASQCDAARAAYDVYRQNAEVYNDPVAQGCEVFNGQTFCVSRSDLDTLFSQFNAQKDLANETFQRIGCQ